LKKPKSKAAVKRLRKRIRDKQDLPPMNRTNRPMTNLEQQVADMLDDMGIEYEREKALKYQAGWRYFDFHLIEHGALIEVDGEYYHDTRGKPSYVIMMAKKNDAIKNWLAKKEGYNLIRIKEKELLQEYDGVKEKISLLVGKENL
jgi:very-short-patch-repair endonuclease